MIYGYSYQNPRFCNRMNILIVLFYLKVIPQIINYRNCKHLIECFYHYREINGL